MLHLTFFNRPKVREKNLPLFSFSIDPLDICRQLPHHTHRKFYCAHANRPIYLFEKDSHDSDDTPEAREKKTLSSNFFIATLESLLPFFYMYVNLFNSTLKVSSLLKLYRLVVIPLNDKD